MQNTKTKSIFIGGAGHSGTSMLLKIFSRHPKALRIGSESRVAEAYDMLEKQYQKIDNINEKLRFLEETAFYGAKFKKKKYEYEKNKPNPLEGSLAANDLKGIFNIDYQNLIKESLRSHQLDFVVEKTPSNVFHINEILKLAPDFKLIIIHRDVRDVVASLKKRYLTLIENPEVFSHNLEIKKLDKDYNLIIDALMWNKAVKKSFKNIKKYGNSRVKIIQYEDFVRHPEKTISILCEWSNIKYHPHMLDIKGRNSAFQDYKNYTGVSSNSVGKYMKVLNSEEISVIENYSKTGIKLLNLKINNLRINKFKVFKLEILSYLKILDRIVKRIRLMNPAYALNFSKRFIKKLLLK